MPNVSRPDLLPFGLPARIGLPYHGLVQGTTLTCADSSTIAYPATHTVIYNDYKRSIVVRGRGYATTVEAESAAPGRRWQNYALLSGAYREIGGNQLGRVTWIYSDSRYSWRVRLDTSQTTNSITLTAVLVGPFGIVADDLPTMAERQLATYTFTPKHRETGASLPAWSGSWRIVSYPGQYGTPMLFWVEPPSTLWPYWFEAVKLTITGDGSISAGSVGDGITATFVHHKNAAETFSGNIYNIGVDAQGSICETTYFLTESYDGWTGVEDEKTYVYTQHTGSITVSVGAIWTLAWSWDYVERYWPGSGSPPIVELVSGTYPDTVDGLGRKTSNSDIISVEIGHPGGGVTHHLVHLTAGLLVSMPTASYWTPACDPIRGDYSMVRADEFYV